MLLRDLLAHPALGLRLLHAGSAPDAIDRPVRWVYTTDLIDPARYLSGGELVISGLVWRRKPADSERFVAAVAGADAVALAAGEAVFHGIPDDLVEACRRHGLPLLAVPEEVSFAAVTELVVGALTAARGDRLAHTLGRQRQLLSAVAGGLGLDELAAEVSAATGVVIRVLSATGRAVVPGPTPLPADELDAVVTTFLTAERLPAVVPGIERSVFPVGPASEQRVTSWFVAADGDCTTWDAEIGDTVGELVAITALDRARRSERLRLAREITEDAIALIASGSANRPETAVRLRQAGLDPEGSLVVAVNEGLVVALLPAGPPDAPTDAVIGAALRLLGPGLAPDRLTVGVSRPATIDALSGALQEARHARELAARRPGPVHVVTGAEVTSHVALLAAVPDEVRRAFAARVLEPVLDYDARTGAGLQETLEAFLECSGSWSRAAQRLHLHVNTVRYRIGRVEELTGRNPAELADRVDVYLALR